MPPYYEPEKQINFSKFFKKIKSPESGDFVSIFLVPAFYGKGRPPRACDKHRSKAVSRSAHLFVYFNILVIPDRHDDRHVGKPYNLRRHFFVKPPDYFPRNTASAELREWTFFIWKDSVPRN